MPQDRESGAKGRAYGLRSAKGVAKLMGLTRPNNASNEVFWEGQRAVIKSCRPATSSFGVTASMLPRLDTILAALEDDRGQVQVWALPAADFGKAMYDSRSSAAVGGRVKLVKRSLAMERGRPVARFTRAEIDSAADS
jgi:hypothetical protein